MREPTLLRRGRALALPTRSEAGALGLLALILLLLLVPGTARAEEEVPFTLAVDSDLAEISFAELSPRLAADLGQPVLQVAPGRRPKVALSVRFRSAKRELAVRADHGDGRTLERVLQPRDGEELATATMLAENLARDEARELLDGFAARDVEPTATAPGASPSPAERGALREEADVYVSAALLYPLATNLGRPNATTHVDLSLLYGRAGAVEGAQLGSFGAYASRSVRGAQLTAFGGYARRVAGAQLAGAVAVAHDAAGVQLASGLAYADTLAGVQAAPFSVARDVTGLQLGVVNVGRKVRGVQLGVVNVADEVDGVALGMVSVSRNGVRPLAFASSLAFWNVGLKFQTRYVYSLVAFTYGTLETKYRNAAVTAALGGRVPLDVLLPHLDLEPEAYVVHVVPARSSDGDGNLWLGGRVSAGYSLARHLRLFAGGGARFPLVVAVGAETVRPELVGGVQF